MRGLFRAIPAKGLLFDGRRWSSSLAILWPLVLFLYAFAIEHIDPARSCSCLGAGKVDFGWRCILLGVLLLLAGSATLRFGNTCGAATSQGRSHD